MSDRDIVLERIKQQVQHCLRDYNGQELEDVLVLLAHERYLAGMVQGSISVKLKVTGGGAMEAPVYDTSEWVETNKCKMK